MQRVSHEVALERIQQAELPLFRRDLQGAFASGLVEAFGAHPDEPIPSDDDIDESVNGAGAVTYHLLAGGMRVGGAVVVIDEETGRNALDFFFVLPEMHGQGLGHRAWREIEKAYPGTKIWETHTPYFDKRNIHFYVNKCGFRIVEFFNPRHVDPHMPPFSGVPDDGIGDGMFRFEKQMR